MDLNHLHLHVKDLNKTSKFYEDHFGFREHIRHDDILFLKNENDFDLALRPDSSDWDFPKWFHFGFRLNSPDEVKNLFEQIKKLGENIDTEIEVYDDFVFFRVLDPDGNKIEVYWE